MKTLFIRAGILSIICIFIVPKILYSQDFRTPRPSPGATVSQTVGVTDVSINYSRPGVKNRVIWGQLVPYNKVWRTGANAVTSITFTDPVKINGNPLNAGTYGIHTIPTENDWTILFSGNTQVGGSSEFNEQDVVLKINVKPEAADFTERMIFTFTDVTDTSSNVNLIWDKLKISFEITTQTQQLVLAKAGKAIDWSTPMQAATYCLQNNVNLDKAINWINASTEINENYWNLRIKARLLEKIGKKSEAVILMEKAIKYGNEMNNKPFDFDQMQKLLKEWKG